MIFRAKQDFYCQELQSQYCSGLTYTVRTGNTRLAQLVNAWLMQGLVEQLPDTSIHPSVAAGVGKVSSPSVWERWKALWR